MLKPTAHFTFAFIVSVSLAMAATWPAVLSPDAVIGHWQHPDTLSNHWLLLWVSEQFLSGQSLLHNTHYYWPEGDYPLLAGNGTEGFLFLVPNLILPWPYSATVYVLAILSLNGIAAWWSARQLGVAPPSACIAVAMFGTNPYVLQELTSGRFSQANVAFLCGFLGWFVGTFRSPQVKPSSVALGAILLGLTAIFYWYYAVFAVIAAVILALFQPKDIWTIRWRHWSATIALSSLIWAGPALWYWMHWALIPGTSEAALFPHPEAYGDALEWASPIHHRGPHPGAAVSLITLGLAGFACFRCMRPSHPLEISSRRMAAACIALMLFAFALARGPRLLGPDLPSLYGVFYGALPPLRRFWWPSRHLILVHWAVAMLGALGCQWLLLRLRPPRPWIAWASVGLGCVAVPISLEWSGDLAHTPISAFSPPPIYRQLKDLPPGAMAEVPLSPRLAGHQQQLIYQTIHRRSLFGGHAMWVDRVRPPSWDKRMSDNSFLSAWTTWENGGEGGVFRPDDLVALKNSGLRYVLYNPEFIFSHAEQRYPQALAELLGEPILVSEGAALYDLERFTGITAITTPPPRLSPRLQPADGHQPAMGQRPTPPPWTLLRTTSTPIAGVHPNAPVAKP